MTRQQASSVYRLAWGLDTAGHAQTWINGLLSTQDHALTVSSRSMDFRGCNVARWRRDSSCDHHFG